MTNSMAVQGEVLDQPIPTKEMRKLRAKRVVKRERNLTKTYQSHEKHSSQSQGRKRDHGLGQGSQIHSRSQSQSSSKSRSCGGRRSPVLRVTNPNNPIFVLNECVPYLLWMLYYLHRRPLTHTGQQVSQNPMQMNLILKDIKYENNMKNYL